MTRSSSPPMPDPKKNRRPKAGMRDSAELPISWAKFAPWIAAFVPPTGAFDPTGPWDLRWHILVTTGGMDGRAKPGSLRIQRTPEPPGSITLAIETRVTIGKLQTFVATGTLRCANDALATVRAWELDSIIEDAKAGPLESTRIRERGAVTPEGASSDRGGRQFRLPGKSPITANWSLFDAVQRLAPDASPDPFDMLEDLTLLRRGQRITADETREITLGDRTLKLRGFRQIGEGILPTHYWLDGSGRLIFASCGLRGYLLDTGP